MVLIERLFGLLSLVFLAIGLIVGLAGIDPNGRIQMASHEAEQLYEVEMTDEINEVALSQTDRGHFFKNRDLQRSLK